MSTGHAPHQTDGLVALRSELDQIDAQLLDAIRRRLDVCVRIAEYKRLHGVPMMQPHRVGLVHQRAARYGAEHGIDESFLHSLYDLIITETCRIEDLVIGDKPAG
ncbi:chorismate mutase family protein [Micromonospora tarensis]|uniref:Chorismate mutase family protein n=1 Tax=Micromonospora tarensis TaxID=2806100 RepID=A0ABS1YAK1_9ACTN|nr:chorismate mutase family protein [Micromonospora tarensis]MBM0274436.1 chorismate mutase family protein [Micromonospora tarensis]